jgi:hypothetical protein
LTNPYAPSTVDHGGPRGWSARQLHLVAGSWLIVFGLLHFLAINLLSKSNPGSTVEWTPILLSGLGLLVTIQFRLAIAFTRLIGSFTILGLSIAVVALLADLGDRGGLTYGDVTVTDPQPWQILLMFAGVGVTMIPPWWMLQRALAENHRMHRKMRFDRIGC